MFDLMGSNLADAELKGFETRLVLPVSGLVAINPDCPNSGLGALCMPPTLGTATGVTKLPAGAAGNTERRRDCPI